MSAPNDEPTSAVLSLGERQEIFRLAQAENMTVSDLVIEKSDEGFIGEQLTILSDAARNKLVEMRDMPGTANRSLTRAAARHFARVSR